MNDKAVAVAKDVLARLDVLHLQTGWYMTIGSSSSISFLGDLREQVDLVQEECAVCQLGACLLSTARLFDQVPMSCFNSGRRALLSESTIHDLLVGVFDRDTLDLMEAAFECQPLSWLEASPYSITHAIHFGRRFVALEDRVRAIMENVIDNGGVFVPPLPA